MGARHLSRRLIFVSLALTLLGAARCAGEEAEPMSEATDAPATKTGKESLARLREEMVRTQIQARGVRSEAVLDAMRSVPRHAFVPGIDATRAYEDRPHPIGHRQTISQPYVVALMTELADLQPGERVLEVGTGSGYQAAVLAAMGCEVYTVEIVEPLASAVAERLAEHGYDAVKSRAGDGYRGWPEAAPFDAILVTAAAPKLPEPLKEQLAPGGRLVIPVDRAAGPGQTLEVYIRGPEGLERRRSIDVIFVPMTGEVRE